MRFAVVLNGHETIGRIMLTRNRVTSKEIDLKNCFWVWDVQPGKIGL